MQVFIRPPVESDVSALLDLHCRSRSFHAPWSFPALTQEGCQAYVHRCQADNFQGLLICQQDSGIIIGVANLSQIFYGAFQNAYLGYYADVTYAGLGLMGEGMSLVIHYAFSTLNLHRIEANIQPGNTRSIRLVKRLGFRQEGYSPRYLKIDGEWRDHERWALTTEDCV